MKQLYTIISLILINNIVELFRLKYILQQYIVQLNKQYKLVCKSKQL